MTGREHAVGAGVDVPAHLAQHTLGVVGVGHRAPHPDIVEEGVVPALLPADVGLHPAWPPGLDADGVELFIVGLAAVLLDRQPDVVEGALAELEQGGVAVAVGGDHLAADGRLVVVVVLPALNDDPVGVDPLDEAVRPVADAEFSQVTVVVGAGAHGRVGGPFLGVVQDVGGNDREVEIVDRQRRDLRMDDIEGQVVDDADVLDLADLVLVVDRRHVVVADRLPGKADVLGGERRAVMPAQARMEPDAVDPAAIELFHLVHHRRVPDRLQLRVAVRDRIEQQFVEKTVRPGADEQGVERGGLV